MDARDYGTHITVLAWINIGFSALFGFIGIFALFFLTGIGMVSQDVEAMSILGFVGLAAALFFSALAIPGLAAGYGLLKRRAWGRVLAIIVAVLDLFNIPVGTAIGVYALWLLTHHHATDYFGPAEIQEPPPVPA